MKDRLRAFGQNQVSSNKAFFIMVILFVGLTVSSPFFLTQNNLINVLRQVCVSTVLACGFSVVLGSGHIDLSVGSMVGLIGVFMAMLMERGVPVPLAIFIGVIAGAVFGAINATIISVFALPPFIVTLAMQQILRGVCYLVTNYIPVMNVPEGFAFLGQGYIGIIPVQVYIMVLIAFVVWFLVNRTKFGRYVLAMGGNPEAARVSGIDIVWVRFGTYVCSGCAAALAAMILTARAASAQPAAGTGMEMDAIAAVVIGGTNMKGGKVNVVGALFGCLIVGMVNNGLNLLRIDSAWQIVAKGCLILFAVVLDRISTMSMVRNAERRELKKVGVK